LVVYRGQIRSLWVGLLVALPSGAAVAIAILVDNTASLVGVAISASLMPPAVNAVSINFVVGYKNIAKNEMFIV
jgi:uncharacterized membrane protein